MPVNAVSRKLKTRWTIKEAEDLDVCYDETMEDEIVEMLREELHEQQKEKARKVFSRIPGKRS